MEASRLSGKPASVWDSVQIESETSDNEKDLNDAMDRLGTLGREINILKTKCAENNMAAARAEETATMARDKANEAKQVRLWARSDPGLTGNQPFSCPDAQILDGQLTDKYNEVQQRVDTKAKAVQEAKEKAETFREEANDLLKDAQDKLKRLAGEFGFIRPGRTKSIKSGVTFKMVYFGS